MSAHTNDSYADLRKRVGELAALPPAGLTTSAQKAAWTSGYRSAFADLLEGRLFDTHTTTEEK